MKTVKKALLLVFLTMAIGHLSAQTKNSEEMVVPLSDPSKPVTLEASLTNGSIKVVGYDGKDVIVTVFMDSTIRRIDNDGSGGMRRINTTGGMDVRAEEHDNTVEVNNGGFENKILGVMIRIPQNAAQVKLGTVNGGDISVSNVSGKIEIGNVNGSITAKGISGSVVANTVNGYVLVSFKSVDPKAAMAFSTLNGKIDVTLPSDSKANFKLKSGNGQIYTDFDIDIEKTQPKIEKKDDGHVHEIRIDDWVYGKINGGGPEIMMQSTFGTIFIRKGK